MNEQLASQKTVAAKQQVKNDALISDYTQLSIKSTAIKQEMMEAEKYQKAVREDLALRTQAADAHEANLKLREQKVAQTESQMQTNSELLNL